MTAFAPALPKLERLVPRVGSTSDREVVATVRAIGRVLTASGLDWHDLAAGLRAAAPDWLSSRTETESWGDLAKRCRSHGTGRLSPKEAKFVAAMSGRLVLAGQPTPKQAEWLRANSARLKGGAA